MTKKEIPLILRNNPSWTVCHSRIEQKEPELSEKSVALGSAVTLARPSVIQATRRLRPAGPSSASSPSGPSWNRTRFRNAFERQCRWREPRITYLGRPLSDSFGSRRRRRSSRPIGHSPFEADATTHGKAEAGRLHPYEGGKNQGKPVSETSVRRILENLQMFREGRLVPNGLSDERYGYRPLVVPA